MFLSLKKLHSDSIMINGRLISTTTISNVLVDDSAISLRVDYLCGESFLFKFTTIEECYEELERIVSSMGVNEYD